MFNILQSRPKVNQILVFLFFFNCFNQHSLLGQDNPLFQGKWYKFAVNKTSIYKLTYDQLSQLGFENLQNVKIYGVGGEQLSLRNESSIPGGINEIPVYIIKGDDNVFNQGDYLLCYLEGPKVFRYDSVKGVYLQKQHLYQDYINYFITTSVDEASPIESRNLNHLNAGKVHKQGDWIFHYENNLVNPLKSGRTWYGEQFQDKDFELEIGHDQLAMNSIITYHIECIGRNLEERNATLFLNNAGINSVRINKTEFKEDYPYGHLAIFNGQFNNSSTSFKLKLNYEKLKQNDKAYLDFFHLEGRKKLKFEAIDGMYFFSNRESLNDSISKYALENVSENIFIWNVTNCFNVYQLEKNVLNSTATFIDYSNLLQFYVAFDTRFNFPVPILNSKDKRTGFIEPQDLKGESTTECIIISHPDFESAANELADFHREKDNVTIKTFTTDKIYNEFSSGNKDIAAIRNFLRYMHEKSPGVLKYVILFGDGSYCPKDLNGNTDYVPAYQTLNSLDFGKSYTTDDFYGRLEHSDNTGSSSVDLDVAIGRLPVGSSDEADLIVKKIKNYYKNKHSGNWCLRMMFVADDADKKSDRRFLTNSEDYIRYIQNVKPEIEVEKIYLDAYPQRTSSTGKTYPGAQEELLRKINKGALLVSYSGHGSNLVISSEKVLQKHHMQNLTNKDKLPFMLTISCQVGRYDNIDISKNGKISPRESFAEAALLNPKGGVIGLFTATRILSPNKTMVSNFYRNLLELDEYSEYPRIGDVIRKTKNKTRDDKFMLMGDPLIRLPIPYDCVIIDSINNLSVLEDADTVSAFEKVTISGHLDGKLKDIDSYNGLLQLCVLDKKKKNISNGNDEGEKVEFYKQNNAIYKGNTKVKNGRFSCEFRVPKDISYNFGFGKIQAYAYGGNVAYSGYSNNLIIGGTSTEEIYDYDGPEITLYLNDTTFVNGGLAGENPTLIVDLYDENGINTTGLGIGHDITAEIYELPGKEYILNDYYQAVSGYQYGRIKFQLNDLDEGEYNVVVKAWDIFNNSSDATISFYVKSDNKLYLTGLKSTPNPVVNSTFIHYSHNKAGLIHHVVLDVFDVYGKKVYTVERTNYEDGYNSLPIEWNPRQMSGNIAPGVYPYRLIIKTEDGTESQLNSKLIVL